MRIEEAPRRASHRIASRRCVAPIPSLQLPQSTASPHKHTHTTVSWSPSFHATRRSFEALSRKPQRAPRRDGVGAGAHDPLPPSPNATPVYQQSTGSSKACTHSRAFRVHGPHGPVHALIHRAFRMHALTFSAPAIVPTEDALPHAHRSRFPLNSPAA